MGTVLDLRMIGIGEIRRNPWNRVRSVKELEVIETAESIKVEGLQQPIKVRPLSSPELTEDSAKAGKMVEFELVFGEGRWLACRLAGLSEIPCFVEEMSDDRVKTLMALENLQHKDLNPFESAHAIQLLADLGWTWQQVGEHLGKSAAWVARRAGLTSLSERWREMVRDPEQAVSKWSSSHLELIARMPAGVQDELAHEYESTREDYGGGDYYENMEVTLDELRRHLGHFYRALDGAPWKTGDGELVVDAGSCDACRKRSDCQAELFDEADFKGANKKSKNGVFCLDADCWARKMTAWLKQEESALRTKHGTVELVSARPSWEDDEDPEWAGKTVRLGSSVETCAKKAEGARPALVVEGDGKGRKVWVRDAAPRTRSGGGSGSGSSAGTDRGKSGKTVAQKKFDYDWRRTRVVVMKLAEWFEGLFENRDELPAVMNWGKMLAFAWVFGTQDRASNMFGEWSDGTKQIKQVMERWDAHCQFSEEHLTAVLFRQACGVVKDNLRTLERLTSSRIGDKKGLESKQEFCQWLCAIVGLNWEALWADACVAVPYAKAWRAEAEKLDGKKAAGGKGKGKAKGKGKGKVKPTAEAQRTQSNAEGPRDCESCRYLDDASETSPCRDCVQAADPMDDEDNPTEDRWAPIEEDAGAGAGVDEVDAVDGVDHVGVEEGAGTLLPAVRLHGGRGLQRGLLVGDGRSLLEPFPGR